MYVFVPPPRLFYAEACEAVANPRENAHSVCGTLLVELITNKYIQMRSQVKGGGHATNPDFSSTSGVQISMARFNTVTYNKDAQNADVGAGMIWDDVYAALEPFGVTVVGGRVTGIGVAGFTLGGGESSGDCVWTPDLILTSTDGSGYSWLTNQRGLTVDNTLSFEVVHPNGQVSNVTKVSNPELFFALRVSLMNPICI